MSTEQAAAARRERLAESAAGAGLTAYLVTNLVDVRWLTGFNGSNGACLVGPDRAVFLTDFRYEEVARAKLKGWDIEIVRGDWLAGLAAALKNACAAGPVAGFQDDDLTVRSLRKLEKGLAGSGIELRGADLVKGLRRAKDAAEIEAIAAASGFADQVYRDTVAHGLAGRSEMEVARFALVLMRERGAEPSFPPIVATGPNGALPHAEPGERVIADGDLVVFDMGVDLGGVCSDCTRTYAVGRISEEAAQVYELVLAAQAAGLAAVHAGAEGKAVDAAAREVIAAAGYGDRFGHGLGHGVGLEVHEAPRLSPLSSDTLAEGDVVTVEPGIYLPGRLGVRIEDLVVVTADGYRNLSGLPKDLVAFG